MRKEVIVQLLSISPLMGLARDTLDTNSQLFMTAVTTIVLCLASSRPFLDHSLILSNLLLGIPSFE